MASSSHNNSSSVDEAEKHLLGNLLEDDPFSPPRSSPNRNICASSGGETSGPPTPIARANSGAQVVVGQPQSAVPNTSVINGVALGPVGDVGRFWPEPPPPYTASIQSSWTSSALKPTSPSPFGDSTANPLSDFLQAQLFKDTPTNLNDILTSEPALLRQFAASRQSKFPQTATPQPPAQIHHIHHNFHTHTHNIVENHHHYPLPPHGFAGTPEALFNPSTISAARAVATAANSAHTNRFAHHSIGQNIGAPPNQGSGGKGKGSKSYVNVATAGHQNQQQQRHQSASSVSQALSNQGPPTAACIYNIHYDDPPHSAPVLNKMPFSYRDVAARSDAHTATSGSGSPLQMMKRNRDARQAEQISPIGGSGAISEGESTRPDTKRSSDALSTDNEIHINTIIAAKQLQKDRKAKSENGFQKITAKKSKGIKEKIPLTETNSLPVANDESVMMEAPTRYEVLQKLATSPKMIVAEHIPSGEGTEGIKKRVPARAAIIRSRSNSVTGNADEDETENVQSGNGQRAIAAGLNAAKRMFPVVDKKKPAAAAKKRSGRKRSETPMWDVIAHYITLFAGMMGTMLYGLFNMIFDIAVALWGIIVHYLKMAYTFVLMKLRQCCVSTISGIRNTVYAVVSFRPDQLFDALFDQPGPFGLEFTIQSTKVEEIMDLLVSRGRRSRDAYVALGLRADCTDEEIRKNYGKICGLLQHSSHEAVEEVLAVMMKAYGILHSSANRHVYKSNVLPVISAHKELLSTWDAAIERIIETRTTMLCDCGKRHRRRPLTEIRPSEARYCKRCGIYHPAKANDIWVESRLFGLSWVYFTCADGLVYEITEWATCEANFLKHMRPNAHHVQYRLVSPSLTDRDVVAGSGKLADDIVENSAVRLGASSALTQQVSFRPAVEPRDEDRNRRAANRRQKRR